MWKAGNNGYQWNNRKQTKMPNNEERNENGNVIEAKLKIIWNNQWKHLWKRRKMPAEENSNG